MNHPSIQHHAPIARCLGTLAALLLLATGCARTINDGPNDPQDLEQWTADVRARPAPELDPLPVMHQFETFEYAAQGLRDPFSNAFTDVGTGTGPRPDPNRPKQALEQFPLDALVMVGTLGSGGNLQALVMAPDKVTYRVRPGMYLGESDGRVVAVDEYQIELVEIVPDGTGGWTQRPASIAMEQ